MRINKKLQRVVKRLIDGGVIHDTQFSAAGLEYFSQHVSVMATSINQEVIPWIPMVQN